MESEGVEVAVEYIKENEEQVEQIKKEYEIAEKASQELAKQRFQEINV